MKMVIGVLSINEFDKFKNQLEDPTRISQNKFAHGKIMDSIYLFTYFVTNISGRTRRLSGGRCCRSIYSWIIYMEFFMWGGGGDSYMPFWGRKEVAAPPRGEGEMLKELTFKGVATTRGASGESLTAKFSCMKRLSTIDSSLGTIL